MPTEELELAPVQPIDLKQERIQYMIRDERAFLNHRLANLDRIAAILQRIPLPLISKCELFQGGLEVNRLTHGETIEIMGALRAGKWKKSANPSYPIALDYAAEIDGIRIRLWAAAPPGSCRIIEEEEEIPAQPATKVVRRKLVCA